MSAPSAEVQSSPRRESALGVAGIACGLLVIAAIFGWLWMSRGHKPLAVMVEGDARMATEVHVMRAFRSTHPAAKLFGQWVAGGQGRRVAASLRGWRPAPR